MNVVSFSGGRTSAYLVYLMEQRKKVDPSFQVTYIFMDTGAEHPKTYEFIKNVVKYFNINLVCLRVEINPELGKGSNYKQISIDDIKYDLKPWEDMLRKYGTPYIGGAFCTDRMKLQPFKKYCEDNFGKGNYTTWLGIRADGPKRLTPKTNIKYLAEISDFEKPDILSWWKEQEFDLGIEEYLGNCVFCIKKSINKVALAIKDEPILCSQMINTINADSVRVVDSRTSNSNIMYRGNNNLESIIAMFSDVSREDLFATLRRAKKFDTGSCSESCEVFLAEETEQLN